MTTTGRIVRSAVFIGTIIIVLVVLFNRRDAQVDAILREAQPGDLVEVSSDVCNVLRDKTAIKPTTNCRYRRGDVIVEIIKIP